MAFCSRLEHPVLARPCLSPRRSSGPPLSRHRLWQWADLPPSGCPGRARDRLRLLREPDRKAKSHSINNQSLLTYHVIDATDEQALLSLGQSYFDAALSNMALFDMADLEPLFRTLPKLLKPGGTFVFSLTHPAFNNSSSIFTMEEFDDGEIKTI